MTLNGWSRAPCSLTLMPLGVSLLLILLPAAATWPPGLTGLTPTLHSAFYFAWDHSTWVQILGPSLTGHYGGTNKLLWDLKAELWVRQEKGWVVTGRGRCLCKGRGNDGWRGLSLGKYEWDLWWKEGVHLGWHEAGESAGPDHNVTAVVQWEEAVQRAGSGNGEK